MCFHNKTILQIIKTHGVDTLTPSNCWGIPCIALKETGEHLHFNTSNLKIRIEMDLMDYDTLLKLQGKSN